MNFILQFRRRSADVIRKDLTLRTHPSSGQAAFISPLRLLGFLACHLGAALAAQEERGRIVGVMVANSDAHNPQKWTLPDLLL
jgi:hypothetical protein